MHNSDKYSLRVSSDGSFDEITTNSSLLDRNRKLLVFKKLQFERHNECNSSSEGTPVFKKPLNRQLKNHIMKYYSRGSSSNESTLSLDPDKVPKYEVTDKMKHIIEKLPSPKTQPLRIETLDFSDNKNQMSDKIGSTEEPAHGFDNITFNDRHQSGQSDTSHRNEENLSKRSIRNRKRHKTPQIMKILNDIKRQQSMVNLVIPRLSLLRVVRDVMQKYPNFGIHSGAIAALHESSEIMLIDLFEDVDKFASHRNRITIGLKDLELAMDIHKKYDKSFA